MKHTPGIALVSLNKSINFSIQYITDTLVRLNFQVESIGNKVEIYGQATVYYSMCIAVRADIEIRKFQMGIRSSTARGVCAELSECEKQIERKILKAMNSDEVFLDGGYV
jgi:hypothetical protein